MVVVELEVEKTKIEVEREAPETRQTRPRLP